jgi:phosphohistidine phosphatase
MPRQVVLIRHAKAESFGPSDHERALAARGLGDAAAVGGWLRTTGISPDVALVSSALRTRETFAEIAKAAGWSLEPWVDSTLYDAGIDSVLELLHAQEPSVQTAVLVGHNPTIAAVAFALDNGQGEPLGEFSTSALAVLEFDGDWQSLEPGGAVVTAYATPRA